MACLVPPFIKVLRSCPTPLTRFQVPRTLPYQKITCNQKQFSSDNKAVGNFTFAKLPIICFIFGWLSSFLFWKYDEIERSKHGRFNFIADTVEKVADGVVWITCPGSSGSGFIVRHDGNIITNAHVVGGRLRRKVKVNLRDGRTFDGLVEHVDMGSDLALVKINAYGLKEMTLGSAAYLRAGEWVAALGHPLSMTYSVTVGVVSSSCRKISFKDPNISYIQTDACILQGSSGGPLVNLKGEVVGVNSMTMGPGVSFAIPADYVNHFLSKKGIKSDWEHELQVIPIGISHVQLTPFIRYELSKSNVNLPPSITNGIIVLAVQTDSPAHRAGLKKGDIIYEVDGRPVTDVTVLLDVYRKKKSAKVSLWREQRLYTALLQEM